jgi:uroporphyrinogen-III synthase
MSRALEGFRVALAEGRQLDELADLLSAEGAIPLRHPLVGILDAPDQTAVLAWIESVIAGPVHLLIFFTGEGVQRLLNAADRNGRRSAFLDAIRKIPILTRGPKPLRALKTVGVAPQFIAAPPTTEGVIAALEPIALEGQTVGVQLYGSDNPTLAAYLKTRKASVHQVIPYVYAPASDAVRVVELITDMAAGKIDAICFTSSPQVTRLIEVATEEALLPALSSGMSKLCVAAVGPVVAATLREHRFRVDVCPEQGFVMKNLVQQLKRFRTNRAG